MNRRQRFAVVLALVASLAAISTVSLAQQADQPVLRVTVTNLTRGQVLSPPVVIAHDGTFALFAPGEPASDELAQLAEDAASDALLALAGTLPSVKYATIGSGVIPPGESLSVDLALRGLNATISVAGMLVTTNDAFYAATAGLRGAGSSRSAYATAWDAGSEANTEQCAHIPGPPCGNGGVRVTEGAEGFVHVHAGVHGLADLDQANHDWRNPVALVTVERAR